MKVNKFPPALFLVLVFASVSFGQRNEIMMSISEQFMSSLLDAVFAHSNPEFSLSTSGATDPACPETIRLLREAGGVRTAVQFREGRIYTPIAFTGSYNPPLVGCLNFSGYAQSTINFEFEPTGQRLIAKVSVNDVVLNGIGSVGSTVVTQLVQRTIDRKLNPIEVVKLDRLSFPVPIQGAGQLRMRATGIRTEVVSGGINVYVAYEFVKV